MRIVLYLLILVSWTSWTSLALATDGVHEINQTCAVQTGCFAGDTAGFPVTITGAVGRSYRLTSDLLVPDRDTTAIEITRRDTSVDLNGFQIILSLCQSLSCAPISGTGYGIYAPGARGVSVRNGSIVAMGDDGVALGSHAVVTNLRVRWNGNVGISVLDGSAVEGNTSSDNGGYGILCSLGSTISRNVVRRNQSNGIACVSGSTIIGNTVAENDSTGILAYDGSIVVDNMSNLN